MVCHLDGNKANNRATNLEWRVSETAVWQVDRHTDRRITIYRNATLAAKVVGGDCRSIKKCITGRQQTCGGYKWQRASREDVAAFLVCGDN